VVSFAGLTSPGLYLVRVAIPQDLSPGTQMIQVSAGPSKTGSSLRLLLGPLRDQRLPRAVQSPSAPRLLLLGGHPDVRSLGRVTLYGSLFRRARQSLSIRAMATIRQIGIVDASTVSAKQSVPAFEPPRSISGRRRKSSLSSPINRYFGSGYRMPRDLGALAMPNPACWIRQAKPLP
jgi:hypothetical protein